jgi:hypothetical protein
MLVVHVIAVWSPVRRGHIGHRRCVVDGGVRTPKSPGYRSASAKWERPFPHHHRGWEWLKLSSRGRWRPGR